MMTRRTVLGSGLVLASFAATGVRAAVPDVRKVDALLLDGSVALPIAITDFVDMQRHTLPVEQIRLDAGGIADLGRLLGRSAALAGVSSGATLFVLERIAREHSFRLAVRSQQCASGPGSDACRSDLAALLGGAMPAAVQPAQAYAPSRADGLLHLWVIERRHPIAERNAA